MEKGKENFIEGADFIFERNSSDNVFTLSKVLTEIDQLECLDLDLREWMEIHENSFEQICEHIEESKAKRVNVCLKGEITKQETKKQCLENQKMLNQRMDQIFGALGFNKRAEFIEIDFERSGHESQEWLRIFGKGISANEQMSGLKLNLRYCEWVNNDGIFCLSKSLQEGTQSRGHSLKHLDLNLEFCFLIGDVSMHYLSDAIRDNTFLKYLSLNVSACNISDVGVLSLFEALSVAVNLVSLNFKALTCDKISDVSLLSLSNCLKNTNNSQSLQNVTVSLGSTEHVTNLGIQQLLSTFELSSCTVERFEFSLEDMQNITSKILQYAHQRNSSPQYLKTFILRITQCPLFNDNLVENLANLILSKERTIPEMIFDFRKSLINPSSLSLLQKHLQNTQSNQNHCNLSYTATLGRMQVIFATTLHAEIQEIQNILNDLIIKQVIFSISESSPAETIETVELLQSVQLSFHQLSDKELNVNRLECFHPNNNKNVQILLKLSQQKSLLMLRLIPRCLQQFYANVESLSIKIINFFQTSTTPKESITKEKLVDATLMKEKDEENSQSLLQMISRFPRSCSSLKLEWMCEGITDASLLSISTSIANNSGIHDWSFTFSDCSLISDEGIARLLQEMVKFKKMQLSLLNCLYLTDLTIRTLSALIQENIVCTNYTLQFSNSTLISDEGLNLLKQTIETNTLKGCHFDIKFISCIKPSLKSMVYLDKIIKKINAINLI